MSDPSGKPTSAPSGRFPRRFYKEASIGKHEAGFAVLLDGRLAKTPAGNPLAVADERVAAALAGEWAAQGEKLDPAAMPLTRIVNSAIDGVSREMDAVRADIVRHAGSDLVCYRAEGPDGLVAKQEAGWAPLLAFAREVLGARFVLAEGVMHVEQRPEALAAVERALRGYDALSLAAMHVVTTLTGSALIALALGRRQIGAEEAWAAAHVDEDWQMSQWGEDEQALARRAARRRDFDAAAFILGAV
jgi:chaperone required for assembly of F1-ATPase